MSNINNADAEATHFAGGLDVTESITETLDLKHIVSKAAVFRFNFATGTVETDLGEDLPADALVDDVLVYVRTAEATGATKTLDVGILSSESGGDADGFLDGISVSSTGLKRSASTITTGANNTFLASSTRGAFLRDLVAGEDVAAGGDGFVSEKPFLTSSVTGKSVSVTPGSNDFAELVADIIFVYRTVETPRR